MLKLMMMGLCLGLIGSDVAGSGPVVTLSAEDQETCPVDPDYWAEVGDSAVLGTADRWREKEGRRRISPPMCFSGAEKLQQYLDLAGKPATRIDGEPDSYRPRAGTPAIVRERRLLDVSQEGATVPVAVLRVEVAGGEFKDRLFWTISYNVFRFKPKAK